MKKAFASIIVSMLFAASLFAQSHSVGLTCTAATGTAPSGFNFFRATTSGGEGTTPINATAETTCTFTDTAVSAGTKYFYTATEIVGGVSSSQSAEASATVPVFPPTNAKLTVSGTTGTVTWTASSDSSAAYNIFAGTSSGGESTTPVNSSPVAAGCSGAACTYTMTGLVIGNSEFIKIQAVINGVSSVASNEATSAVAVPTVTGLKAIAQ